MQGLVGVNMQGLLGVNMQALVGVNMQGLVGIYNPNFTTKSFILHFNIMVRHIFIKFFRTCIFLSH